MAPAHGMTVVLDGSDTTKISTLGGEDRGIFNRHVRRTHDTKPPSNRMYNYQWNAEHSSDAVRPKHGNISKDT